jgi:hypothetical protein
LINFGNFIVVSGANDENTKNGEVPGKKLFPSFL